MEFGVHLPLLAFRRQAFSLSQLVDYAETGVRKVFLWPIDDELNQLRVLSEKVLPQIPGQSL